MKDRILNLLSLCMEAHKAGHHVNFTCGFYDILVHHMIMDESGDYQTANSITVGNDASYDEAESYLRGLIS